MHKNYFVSSLAFLGQPVDKMVRICIENQINLEFSSGMPFMQNMEEIYLNAKLSKMPHNYFPAPETPFVLNLGSKDEQIRKKSIEHCKNGLRLSSISASPFFAAHAGFCIDPNPEELGRKIAFSQDFDDALHKKLFRESVLEILEYADQLGIDFLIENNVLAPFNYNGVNPLLCCDSGGINEFFKEINHPRIGLLLDTAHLKVTSNTLQLDLEDELDKIRNTIKAIHHSDNNGEIDDNQPLGKNYWFLKHMSHFNSLVHVLEVKKQSLEEINEQISLLQNFGN
ncbi:sugar phosphate isomerase/epimerase family protein [Algoriphagus yeomjeoni]|uniref:sugar phosphate isomerase/epimerase family protein n=1 Tax=Algoriphagus yeomjeoni TaxID=291403 RepID=UPI003CE55FBB